MLKPSTTICLFATSTPFPSEEAFSYIIVYFRHYYTRILCPRLAYYGIYAMSSARPAPAIAMSIQQLNCVDTAGNRVLYYE